MVLPPSTIPSVPRAWLYGMSTPTQARSSDWLMLASVVTTWRVLGAHVLT
jgi:hypothetical protein